MKKKEKQQEPRIIQAEKPAKKSHKKRNIIIAVAVLCVIALFVDEPDDSATSNVQPDGSAAAFASVPPEPEPEPKPESQSKAGGESVSEPVSVSEPKEPEHINIFMDAMVQERPIMNGIKTERIGQYARIIVSKEMAKNAPMEDFVEFANQKVRPSGDKYNYWIVDFSEDDSVVYFSSSFIGTAMYYNHYNDEDGITDQLGIAMATFDDNDNVTGYVYESTVDIDE